MGKKAKKLPPGTIKTPFTDQEWMDLRLACEVLAGYYKGDVKQHWLDQCDFGGPRHKQIDRLAQKVDADWRECLFIPDGMDHEIRFVDASEDDQNEASSEVSDG